jgi:hypothetical protein
LLLPLPESESNIFSLEPTPPYVQPSAFLTLARTKVYKLSVCLSSLLK